MPLAHVLRRVVLSASLLLLPAVHAAQIGSEDTTMAFFVDVPGIDNVSATAIAVQPDGKLLLAGWTDTGATIELVVLRTSANGVPDPDFSGDGVVRFDFGNGTRAFGGWIGVLPDGRVMAAGTLILPDATPSGIGLLRLLPNGSFDTTFSVDGRTVLGGDESVGCNGDRETCAVAMSNDGTLLVAGFAQDGQAAGGRMYKLRPDGSPDGTFGEAGVVRLDALPGNAALPLEGFFPAIAQRQDGRIVWASASRVAPSGTRVAVVQLSQDGTIDSDFGDSGATTLPVTAGEHLLPVGLHLTRDGRATLGLVRSDFNSFTYAAARFLADGRPDPAFGSGGLAAIDPAAACASSGCEAQVSHVDARGRVYVIGRIDDPQVTEAPDTDLGVVRFTGEGLPDTRFGPDGRRAFGRDVFGPGLAVVVRETGRAVAEDRQGQLVIAGTGLDGEGVSSLRLWRIRTETVFGDHFD